MKKRLTDEIVEKLYAKYDTPHHVILHCRAVSYVGKAIAEELNKAGASFDTELIRISGLVHDVLRKEADHDLKAGELLDELGYADAADVVRTHMRYEFNDENHIDETDIMCLADRLVKEDKYVGIDERVEYLIHKPGENPERTRILTEKKEATKAFMRAIEIRIGRSIDSLFYQTNPELESKLASILRRVEKPARYIGGEKNTAIRQPEGKLRFAFAFPDLYEIGMSYLGIQILYNILNKRDDIYCERVFAPACDMAELMRNENLPLFTLETKTPVSDMDVLGFTLQYEMSFTNILDMLDLAGIPLLSKERTDSQPLIIAGGPCAYNPEPLVDFVDVFLIGDGEEALPEFLALYKAAKDKGISKKAFFESVASITGVYIPSFYDAVYNEDGTVAEYLKLNENAPDRVKRALIDEIETVDFPVEPIVPFIETVHDRAVVETFRGCTRGCRFCQAGMIYRPIRERTSDTITELAMKQLKNTGHEELSILSLSTSDYSDFETLATSLMDKCADMNVSLSLPSLRLDTFSFKVLNEIQKYRKSGLTFAPEAGTQRLRDVINKGITEDDIFSAVKQAIELGWKHIKFYFMIGLPTETYEDLDGIADIARKVMNINRTYGVPGRFNVTVSVSNFVPKPHTPFQWAAQDTVESLRKKHDYLKGILKIKGVTFHYHDDSTSVMEAVIARGDRRCGKLILDAWKRGCRMDGWSEHFDEEKWKISMAAASIDPAFYASRERSLDEVLPWHIIDPSVSDSYLLSEWKKAVSEQTTHDCRYGCTGCGINRRTKCKLGGIYG